MPYAPPYSLTNALLSQVAAIAELVGMWKASNNNQLVPHLRKGNRIKTIQASLAVEQNTLTVEQVTDVIEGKTVLGLPREIQEVRNAFNAYEKMQDWDPHSIDDLLTAHGLLMYGLIDDAGHLRSGGTGIYQGKQLVHMAPPASQLPRLIGDLMTWLKQTDAHPLIASAAFHYEFEFIHPFSDGNGRMGRLWQTVLLHQWQPMLAYLPVETVIKHRQEQYYQLLGEADASGDCTNFISFLLQAIHDSLQEAITKQPSEEKTRVETREKTRVETRVETPKLKTPEKILHLLAQNPQLTQAELAEVLSLSTSAVERAVAKLKAAGKLTYEGPKKGGQWRVCS